MNATAPAEQALHAIPLEQISLGKNYRHRRPANWETKLDELGQSMKQNGQLEPVLLRPLELGAGGYDTYEVVFGERRYRAPKKAGLETLLAIVRDVPDDQVLELQLAENDDRDNPHPLDEAEAFAELLGRGKSPADIAATRGRPVRYIRERLELVKLHPKATAALDEGRILLGHALLLCRIPEKLQAQALQDLESSDDPLNLKEAGEWVQEHFMLKLATAPFDRADAELVPKAGPCTVCPRRTGNQGELFGDVKSPDLCTDPICFRSKLEARWKGLQKTAKAEGKEIVPKGEVTFFEYSGSIQSKKWALLAGEHYTGRGQVKVTTLLGKDVKPALAQNPDTGAIVEVVPRAAVEKAARAYVAKKAKGSKGSKSSPAREKVSPSEKSRREKQKLEAAARDEIVKRTLDALVAGCEKLDPETARFADVMREVVVAAVGYEGTAVLERRSGKKVSYNASHQSLAKLAEPMKEAALLGLLLEGSLAEQLDFPTPDMEKRIVTISTLLKVDRKAIKDATLAELKAKADAEKAAAPASKPKAKKAAKKKAKAR